MNDSIVVITSGFPFGNSETFLESEIIYLSKTFKEIIIFCPIPNNDTKRYTPNNCRIVTFNIKIKKLDKIKALYGIFSLVYKNEINYIKENYNLKITNGIRKTALISLFQAKRISKRIQNICPLQLKNSKTVFYSYWCDDTALALALLRNNCPKLKAISRMHRWDIYFEENTYNYLPFRNYISNSLFKIFSISDDGIKYAIKTWKISPKKFHLSRLGVNNTYSSKYSDQRQVIRIVSCSNIIPVKRVNLIAETLKGIKDIEIEWTHFGDGILMDTLKSETQKISSNILINLPGRISNFEIFEAYSKICPNIFINVSSSEGVPVSIMEAMSFGIPVIATDVGGNSEIVTNENGVLLPENPSTSEIRSAIENVINHVEKRNIAYQTWKENYSAEKNYSDFVKLIQEIL